jgi:uncharacterized protein (TIGR00255 family)
MTAYGRGEYESDNAVFTAEVKSLNNRYRDIILRVPAVLQDLEDVIRNQISSRVRRGRIEVSIQVSKKDDETNNNLELNRPLIKSYLTMMEQLDNEFGVHGKIGPDSLLQIRDVVLMKPQELDMDESRKGIEKVMVQALDSLDSMRIQEGKIIEKDIFMRLELIKGYLDEVEKKSPVVVDEYRLKLKSRIDIISEDIEVDEGRLAQEVAIFANRCDITEEIVRSGSHLKQFREYMSMDDSIGRRLDFLVQELNREINTISSKASDSSISANAVEVKAELEKIREQIQNVE